MILDWIFLIPIIVNVADRILNCSRKQNDEQNEIHGEKIGHKKKTNNIVTIGANDIFSTMFNAFLFTNAKLEITLKLSLTFTIQKPQNQIKPTTE